MKSTEELLTQWGIWSWQGAGVPRCTSPMYALMRDNVAQHSEPAANISDDDALRVDRIIGTMRRYRPQMAEIITYYYRNDMTMSQVAATQKDMTRLRVREIIQAGHAYVEAGLDMEVAA